MMRIYKNNLTVELPSVPADWFAGSPGDFFQAVFGFSLGPDFNRSAMVVVIEAQDGSKRENVLLSFVGRSISRAIEPTFLGGYMQQQPFAWDGVPCRVYSAISADAQGVMWIPFGSWNTRVARPSAPVVVFDLTPSEGGIEQPVIAIDAAGDYVPRCTLVVSNYGALDITPTVQGNLVMQDGSAVVAPVLGPSGVRAWYLDLLIHDQRLWNNVEGATQTAIVLHDVRLPQ